MPLNSFSVESSRRRFLAQMGGLVGLSCAGLVGQQTEKTDEAKPRFLADSGLKQKEAVQFAALAFYLPLLQRLAARLGDNKFLQMMQEELRTIWSERLQRLVRADTPKSLASFFEVSHRLNGEFSPASDPGIPGMLVRFLADAVTLQVVRQEERIVELKISECIYAQVYREAKAWNIGYITHCYPDYVLAKAFDPRLRLSRTKTLMRGDECCNHRYTWEG